MAYVGEPRMSQDVALLSTRAEELAGGAAGTSQSTVPHRNRCASDCGWSRLLAVSDSQIRQSSSSRRSASRLVAGGATIRGRVSNCAARVDCQQGSLLSTPPREP